jgi:multiple sugar transport system substrate-binding protein
MNDRGQRSKGLGSHAPRSGQQRSTRRAMVAAAGVLGAVSLAACAGQSETSAPPKAAKVGGKLMWEIRMGPTYEQLAKDALPLFKQRFPDVQLEYTPKASDWIEKDLAAMAAGSGPDVLTAWSRTVRPFLSKGLALNVNPFLKDLKKADLDDFIKGQWDGYQVPNSDLRWALPTYTNVCVVFYNKGLFRKAGVPEPTANWTYDDYADRAKRLTRQDGTQQVYGGYQPSNVFIRLQNQIWGFGGTAVDPKDSTKSAVHTPQTQAALQWIYDRYWRDGSWIPFKERPTGWNWWAAIANGQLAMGEDGMQSLVNIAKIENADWDIAPVPKGPVAQQSWVEMDGWMIWKDTKSRDAAWELVKFLSGTDFMRMQAKTELLMPARISLLDEWQQTLRQQYPSLANVNLRLPRDLATKSPSPVRTFELFTCQAEAEMAMEPMIRDIIVDGKSTPSVLRDRRAEIDIAAASCGATFK